MLQHLMDGLKKASTDKERVAVLYAGIEELNLYAVTQRIILALLINSTFSKEDKDKVRHLFHDTFSKKIETRRFVVMKLCLEEILGSED